MRRINLNWVLPILICYLLTGFFIYATVRVPSLQWIAALTILAVAFLTMAIILILDTPKEKKDETSTRM